MLYDSTLFAIKKIIESLNQSNWNDLSCCIQQKHAPAALVFYIIDFFASLDTVFLRKTLVYKLYEQEVWQVSLYQLHEIFENGWNFVLLETTKMFLVMKFLF